MMFLGNPCSPAIVEAMCAGAIGLIDTPLQGSSSAVGEVHRERGLWCADNGCFSDRWEEGHWWAWLTHPDQLDAVESCLFAVAPDVVGDAVASHARSAPWLAPIRELGYPVAYVAQDGFESFPVPWDDFDVLFIGGTTEWKLGRHARAATAEAKRRGKWVHMGRVNSRRRWEIAEDMGCDSVDGTTFTRGPDKNLAEVLGWIERSNERPSVFVGAFS